ncbi:hypothetical protein KK062_23955 [Fulvivirgaceae bacterium PWU5]|uniref:Secreted protein n=1 Tax=Dawidia cretensis TaxID=2782350 RepID=A0AAP2E3F0_9BACT|nr:hypothetical protein [Dawidia cretensis]MBT1711318.1 hypothetical protein [Dawidia cretensis]
MKKVRLILAAGACLLAGAAVYANSGAALQFYYTTSAGDVTCSDPFTGTVCSPGIVTQCSVENENNVTVYITQKQVTPTIINCQLRMRN